MNSLIGNLGRSVGSEGRAVGDIGGSLEKLVAGDVGENRKGRGTGRERYICRRRRCLGLGPQESGEGDDGGESNHFLQQWCYFI